MILEDFTVLQETDNRYKAPDYCTGERPFFPMTT